MLFGKHVISDRYQKTCDLKSDFVLGVGGGIYLFIITEKVRVTGGEDTRCRCYKRQRGCLTSKFYQNYYSLVAPSVEQVSISNKALVPGHFDTENILTHLLRYSTRPLHFLFSSSHCL
jgi:hypothetical protein